MPKLIKEYWPLFHKGAVLRIVGLQLGLTIIIGGLLIVTGAYTLTSIFFWLIVVGLFGLGALVSAAVFAYTAKPAKDLLAAVMHIAGEPTDTAPPNPNDTKYATNGFKEALQTLYDLAGEVAEAETQSATKEELSTAAKGALADALDATNCGFIVLGHDRSIVYNNAAAPVHIDTVGKKTLGILFNGTDTLDTWLNECEQHSVHAEHTWTRVADSLPDEENRRFFDVIASYDKGSANETVLTLVDRTATYNVSEQDLDFIAFAAHELRGPITVIRGYLDVLEDELSTVLAADQHELFRRLTVSANRLSGYINNILNTSRYDRRHLKVHLNEDTVAGIYETIRDDMDLRAKAQNRLLTVSIPTTLPTIAADRASISEVLGNLIDNAIKYSNEGGVINVTAEARGEFVEVSVEDHGIGMPGNVVSNLFQKFYRSHRSRETVAGTGIGLYISKAIIESHGGTIGVRSEEGKGSTFTAALPIYATVAAKLQTGDNSNEGLIEHGNGWIKNHSMYRG